MTPGHPSDDRLDRLLGGSPDLGLGARERLREQVLERAAASPAPRRSVGLGWWWAVAAVLVAIPSAVLLTRPRREAGPDLAERGAPLRPSFQLACLVDGAPGPCRRGARVLLDVAPRGYRAFAAVLVGPDGVRAWILPGPQPGARSPELVGAGVLEHTAMLDGPPGTYLVQGVFSRQPLTREEVRAVLEGGGPEAVVASQRVEVP